VINFATSFLLKPRTKMQVLSTAYFPPISWMALLYQQKETIIDLQESYPKQSYRNRFSIATANGKMNLSIPVKKINGNRTMTQEITLDYSQNWQQVHWKSIQAAYQSSPFLLYYEDKIEKLIKAKYDSLFKMNETIIYELSTLIGFGTQINYSEEFIPINNTYQDFRFTIHPKHSSPFHFPAYEQVFMEKHGFIGDLSILDLLFNLGPESLNYLEDIKLRQ